MSERGQCRGLVFLELVVVLSKRLGERIIRRAVLRLPQNRVLPTSHICQLALKAFTFCSTLLSCAVVHSGQIGFDDASPGWTEESVGVES
ncbi:hypothetical protein SD37_09210 [Amycolatopsis orientalis]|uniref:Uncharacterized protein n=1 Tax=Amycolatopsis orientalis TaxID=31958 RepID=A0A193BUA9_AMYOR|nr:hypothetical protein [Amycolatopsis orientalis]ANN15811.1 hypothetical protein SD37_09210 [Amycolatopsis orientalis]